MISDILEPVVALMPSSPIWDRVVQDDKPCSWPGCRGKSELVNVHIDGKLYLYWCCTKCSFAEQSGALVRANHFSAGGKFYDRGDITKARGLKVGLSNVIGPRGVL